MRLRLAAIALAIIVVRNGSVCGQGGPPMITDDPGTLGNRKWEINLAVAFKHLPNETSFAGGLGDRSSGEMAVL